MSLLSTFLGIVERAIQNPQDKAAVQIAIDGLAAWKAIAELPAILRLEADIGAYVALLPPSEAPPALPAPPEAGPARTQSPTDLNLWEQEHPGQ